MSNYVDMGPFPKLRMWVKSWRYILMIIARLLSINVFGADKCNIPGSHDPDLTHSLLHWLPLFLVRISLLGFYIYVAMDLGYFLLINVALAVGDGKYLPGYQDSKRCGISCASLFDVIQTAKRHMKTLIAKATMRKSCLFSQCAMPNSHHN